MKNWLIKKLGGYTHQEMSKLHADRIQQIKDLEKVLQSRNSKTVGLKHRLRNVKGEK